jgi:hypothetical protein
MNTFQMRIFCSPWISCFTLVSLTLEGFLGIRFVEDLSLVEVLYAKQLKALIPNIEQSRDGGQEVVKCHNRYCSTYTQWEM